MRALDGASRYIQSFDLAEITDFALKPAKTKPEIASRLYFAAAACLRLYLRGVTPEFADLLGKSDLTAFALNNADSGIAFRSVNTVACVMTSQTFIS